MFFFHFCFVLILVFLYCVSTIAVVITAAKTLNYCFEHTLRHLYTLILFWARNSAGKKKFLETQMNALNVVCSNRFGANEEDENLELFKIKIQKKNKNLQNK